MPVVKYNLDDLVDQQSPGFTLSDPTEHPVPKALRKTREGLDVANDFMMDVTAPIGEYLFALPKMAISGMAGIGGLFDTKLPEGWKPGDPPPGPNIEQARKNIEETQQFLGQLTAPATERGEKMTKAAFWPFEKLQQGAEYVGGKVFEKTGSPGLATAVETGIDVGVPLLVGQGIRRGVRAVKESTPYRMWRIKERGMAVPSWEEVQAQNPGVSQGELLRRYPAYREAALRARNVGEGQTPKAANVPKAPEAAATAATAEASVTPKQRAAVVDRISELGSLEAVKKAYPNAATSAIDAYAVSLAGAAEAQGLFNKVEPTAAPVVTEPVADVAPVVHLPLGLPEPTPPQEAPVNVLPSGDAIALGDGTPVNRPITVKAYHATDTPHATPDAAMVNKNEHGWSGSGVYLTTNKNYAQNYSDLYGDKGVVQEADITLNNPIETTSDSYRKIVKDTIGKSTIQTKAEADAVTEALKAVGHDGIIVGKLTSPQNEIVVFDAGKVNYTSPTKATPTTGTDLLEDKYADLKNILAEAKPKKPRTPNQKAAAELESLGAELMTKNGEEYWKHKLSNGTVVRIPTEGRNANITALEHVQELERQINVESSLPSFASESEATAAGYTLNPRRFSDLVAAENFIKTATSRADYAEAGEMVPIKVGDSIRPAKAPVTEIPPEEDLEGLSEEFDVDTESLRREVADYEETMRTYGEKITIEDFTQKALDLADEVDSVEVDLGKKQLSHAERMSRIKKAAERAAKRKQEIQKIVDEDPDAYEPELQSWEELREADADKNYYDDVEHIERGIDKTRRNLADIFKNERGAVGKDISHLPSKLKDVQKRIADEERSLAILRKKTERLIQVTTAQNEVNSATWRDIAKSTIKERVPAVAEQVNKFIDEAWTVMEGQVHTPKVNLGATHEIVPAAWEFYNSLPETIPADKLNGKLNQIKNQYTKQQLGGDEVLNWIKNQKGEVLKEDLLAVVQKQAIPVVNRQMVQGVDGDKIPWLHIRMPGESSGYNISFYNLPTYKNLFQADHYPGIEGMNNLFWVRSDVRELSNGVKAKFLLEVQTDWGPKVNAVPVGVESLVKEVLKPGDPFEQFFGELSVDRLKSVLEDFEVQGLFFSWATKRLIEAAQKHVPPQVIGGAKVTNFTDGIIPDKVVPWQFYGMESDIELGKYVELGNPDLDTVKKLYNVVTAIEALSDVPNVLSTTPNPLGKEYLKPGLIAFIREGLAAGINKFAFPYTPEAVRLIEQWPNIKSENGKYIVDSFGETKDMTPIVRQYLEKIPIEIKALSKQLKGKLAVERLAFKAGHEAVLTLEVPDDITDVAGAVFRDYSNETKSIISELAEISSGLSDNQSKLKNILKSIKSRLGDERGAVGKDISDLPRTLKEVQDQAKQVNDDLAKLGAKLKDTAGRAKAAVGAEKLEAKVEKGVELTDEEAAELAESLMRQMEIETDRHFTLGESPIRDIVQHMREQKRIVDRYKRGTFELPERQLPMIDKTEPKLLDPTKDLKGIKIRGKVETTGHVLTPSFALRPFFEPGQNPVIDMMEAVVASGFNTMNMRRWFRDVFGSVKSAEKDYNATLKPLYEQVRKLMEVKDQQDAKVARLKLRLEEVQKRVKLNEKRLASVTADHPKLPLFKEELVRAKLEVDKLNREMKAAKTRAGQITKITKETLFNGYDSAIIPLAKAHPSVRITLAAGGKLPAGITLSETEMQLADQLHQYFEKTAQRMRELGFPTVESRDYMPHMFGVIATDKWARRFSYEPTTPVSMKFQRQHKNSRIWIPDVHMLMEAYIPLLEKKLATQPFLNRWSDFIEYGAPPNMRVMLQDWMKANLYKRHGGLMNSILNGLVTIEYVRLVGLSIAVAMKHATKVIDTLTTTTMLQSLKGLYHTFLVPLQKTAKALGMRGETPELDLFRAYVGLDQLVKLMDETPSLKTGWKLVKVLSGSATMMTEMIDNGVTVFANAIASSNAGLTLEQAHRLIIDAILKANFRGGPDMPLYMKTPVGRTLGMFQTTIQKLAELRGAMVVDFIKGGKDVYGKSKKWRLLRYVAVVGAITMLFRKEGIDILHWFVEMPYFRGWLHGTKKAPYYKLAEPIPAQSPVLELLSQVHEKGVKGGVEHFKYTPVMKYLTMPKKKYPTPYYDSATRQVFGFTKFDAGKREKKYQKPKRPSKPKRTIGK